MVRGGPANRAIRKAKIFAITKVSGRNVRKLRHYDGPAARFFFAGISRARQELLQHRRARGPQGSAARVQRTPPQEERHEKGEIISACAVGYACADNLRLRHKRCIPTEAKAFTDHSS